MTAKTDLHKALCKKLHEIYTQKNKLYKNSFSQTFKEEGYAALRIRLSDKLNRINAITKSNLEGEAEQAKESLCDTLLDLANYAIMGAMEVITLEAEKERR